MEDSLPREETTSAGSIVVPAYNEAHRIGPLLEVLRSSVSVLHARVIIVCNGCDDATADIARRVGGVEVAELATASKTGALNEGDRLAGDLFPRLYVDADAITDVDSIARLFASLESESPIAVRPSSRPVTTAVSWPVRSYLRARLLIPSSRQWALDHLEGHAIYGLNRSARERFGRFPDLLADDAFVDRMFDVDEKIIVTDASVVIPSPPNSLALLRVLTRVYKGNLQLENWLEVEHPDRLFVATARRPLFATSREYWRYLANGGSTLANFRPTTIFDAVVLLSFRAVARIRATRALRRSSFVQWR